MATMKKTSPKKGRTQRPAESGRYVVKSTDGKVQSSKNSSKTRTTRKPVRGQQATTTLQARLDPESKELIAHAAELRHMGITEYIRAVLVPTARKEVEAEANNVLQLTADEQLAFWEALNAPVEPTAAHRELLEIMRGKI